MMIAKQMDIRSNIKKYFDIAYEGEPVIVPRKEKKNVVIISEEEYNRLTQAARIAAYADSYAPKRNCNPDASNNIKAHNMDKLDKIRSFGKNWNGNGAPAFSKSLIVRIQKLLNELNIQPEIFPTAMGTIQFEYDNARKDHMEIEIGLEDTAEIFLVKFNGEESYEEIRVSADDINKKVGEFYG